MKNISYENFIKDINEHKISEVKFEVKDYTHYKDCALIVKKEVLKNGNAIFLIFLHLTKDNYESYCFYKKFEEDLKLFKMGRNKSYTLKQVWSFIEINQISYFT